jgi:hypothetical protein
LLTTHTPAPPPSPLAVDLIETTQRVTSDEARAAALPRAESRATHSACMVSIALRKLAGHVSFTAREIASFRLDWGFTPWLRGSSASAVTRRQALVPRLVKPRRLSGGAGAAAVCSVRRWGDQRLCVFFVPDQQRADLANQAFFFFLHRLLRHHRFAVVRWRKLPRLGR